MSGSRATCDGPRAATRGGGALVRIGLGVGLAGAVALACGLRTDPDDPGSVCVPPADGEAPRLGSCANPVALPTKAAVVQGKLGGCSQARGYCGGDRGPEDVYRIRFANPIDVVFSFDDDRTDFAPTLRVVADPDATGEAPCESTFEQTPICTPEADGTRWRLLAAKGDYYVFVEGPPGGSYALAIELGAAAAGDDCEIFAGPIPLGFGGRYEASSTLPAGQGQVDSKCGSPGTEHRYQVRALSDGTLRASMIAHDATLSPAVGIRFTCAANPELDCGEAGPGGLALAAAPVQAGRIYSVVADQKGVEGGRYSLELSMTN